VSDGITQSISLYVHNFISSKPMMVMKILNSTNLRVPFLMTLSDLGKLAKMMPKSITIGLQIWYTGIPDMIRRYIKSNYIFLFQYKYTQENN